MALCSTALAVFGQAPSTPTFPNLPSIFPSQSQPTPAPTHKPPAKKSPKLAARPAPSPVVTPVPQPDTGVEAIQFETLSPELLRARRESYSFRVSGALSASDWFDTNLTLAPGDHVTFIASGAATLLDGRSETPAGTARTWKDMMRAFPDYAANTGALVGRIGREEATVPFTIGAEKQLAIAATGDLYLRMNISSDLKPSGVYWVQLQLQPSTGQPLPAPAIDLMHVITAALFDDIPRRVQDKGGDPGDMVNFAILGPLDQITRAFADAGWASVDRSDKAAVLHGLASTLQRQVYTSMPMSTLYLFDRPQDLSFERGAPIAVAAARHHLRMWKTDKTVAGKELWVGSATHDVGFERDQRNGHVTHKVDPAIDLERDFIEHSFADSGVIDAAVYVTPSAAFKSAETATGGAIHSDGRIVLMDLRANLE